MSPVRNLARQPRSIMRRSSFLLVVAAPLLGLTIFAAPADPPQPGATGNRDNVPYIGKRDPGGNPVRLAKATGHVSNYSEDKVPKYTLPDPLVLANGERVTTAEFWVKKRRPEILRWYQTEIYGRIPENAPKVTWEVVQTDPNARNGTAVMRRAGGRMGGQPDGREST